MSTNFLENGAFLQVENNRFLVITGADVSSVNRLQAEKALAESSWVLYNPLYWSFLHPNVDSKSYYVVKSIKELNREQFKSFLLDGDDEVSASGYGFVNQSNESSEQPIKWAKADMQSFSEQFDWSQRQFQEGHLKKTVPVTLVKGSGFISVKQRLLYLLDSDYTGFAYGHWGFEDKWQMSSNTDNVEKSKSSFYQSLRKGLDAKLESDATESLRPALLAGCIGVSPEWLFQMDEEHQQLTTAAIAGTWPLNENYDTKILEEHNLVIEDIKQQLSFLNLKQQSKTYVNQLKHFNHLKTDLVYDYSSEQASVVTVLQAMHPTAALGIYPRKHSHYEHLSQFEDQKNRGFHGAPFGLIHKTASYVLVSLRNIQWSVPLKKDGTIDQVGDSAADSVPVDTWASLLGGGQVVVVSGCGVTSDSVLETEWAELKMKRNSILSFLGLNHD